MQNELELPANELPIACNLSDAQRATRGEEIAQNLFKHVQQVKELADGYAYSFPAGEEWAGKLMEFILDERDCCPFFTFELVFESNQGPLWLHLRGGQGVKEFIAGAFGGQSQMGNNQNKWVALVQGKEECTHERSEKSTRILLERKTHPRVVQSLPSQGHGARFYRSALQQPCKGHVRVRSLWSALVLVESQI